MSISCVFLGECCRCAVGSIWVSSPLDDLTRSVYDALWKLAVVFCL